MMARNRYISCYHKQLEKGEEQTDCEFVAEQLDAYRQKREKLFGPLGSEFLNDFVQDLLSQLRSYKYRLIANSECFTFVIQSTPVSLFQRKWLLVDDLSSKFGGA